MMPKDVISGIDASEMEAVREPGAMVYGAVFKDGRFQIPAPASGLREQIVAYIEGQLGPELAQFYKESIPQSVGLGIYDTDWQTGNHQNIRRYITILREDFMSRHQDKVSLLHRLIVKLELGTEAEKTALKKILSIE